jgi:hypothetical protein
MNKDRIVGAQYFTFLNQNQDILHLSKPIICLSFNFLTLIGIPERLLLFIRQIGECSILRRLRI